MTDLPLLIAQGTVVFSGAFLAAYAVGWVMKKVSR